MSGTLKLNDTTFATENAGSISATVDNLDVVTSMTLPKSATDPANPVEGQIYYNTTDGVVKHWNGTEWLEMSNKFTATGGTETEYNGYKYHTFTSSGTFTTKTSGGVEYLIVAGGGGSGTSNGAGGGGAGGLLNGTIYVNQQAYSIVIGAGGANSGGSRLVRAGNGNNSTALGLTAIGGGSAGTEGDPYSEALNRGNDGGSGGSNVRSSGGGYPTGSGTPGQGNNAGANVNDGSPYYSGGGGGGAGAPGTNGSASYMGNGGNGLQFLEWATATSTGADNGYYAGGGAAGAYYSTSPGVGGTPGLGGGGQGGSDKSQSQLDGVVNTGGGGGGHGDYRVASGAGGSGIVIIRYPI